MSSRMLAVVKNGKIEPLEPVSFPEGTQLIVTLNLSAEAIGESSRCENRETEESEWYALSHQGLSRAYDDDEPGYELSQIKEFNPNYEGRWHNSSYDASTIATLATCRASF